VWAYLRLGIGRHPQLVATRLLTHADELHETLRGRKQRCPSNDEGTLGIGLVRAQQLAMWAHIREKAHTSYRFCPSIQLQETGRMYGGTREQTATNSSEMPSVGMGNLPTNAPIWKNTELCDVPRNHVETSDPPWIWGKLAPPGQERTAQRDVGQDII
jgi:hypothetical protein